MFYGRENERAFLQGQFERREAALVVVYGRRRIGKTTLLEKFAGNKKQLYFLATEESEQANFDKFCAIAADVLTDNIFLELRSDWEMAFKLIAEKSVNERVVVVLDEFQYLCSANSAFSSIIQRCWDGFLKNANIMLILCGSHIGMMERDVLAYGAPLYGRRTAQLRLGPLPAAALRPLFPSYSPAQLVETYAVLGGVPAYLLRFDSRLGVMENITRHVLDPSAFLYAEPSFLLREELREPRNYFAVLQAVAQGRTTPNEISQATGMDPGPLARYLATLRELGLLERRVPVTETQPEKSRRGLYMVQDRFLRFWFRFVAPNASALEMGGAAQVAQKVARELPQFVGPVFEDLCRAWTAEQAARARWPLALERFGSFWSPEAEVDVVGLGGEGLLVGECKWNREPVGVSVLADLKRKAEAICARVGRRETLLVLFSRSGFTDALEAAAAAEGVTLVGLEEVLGSRISPGGDDSVTSASAP